MPADELGQPLALLSAVVASIAGLFQYGDALTSILWVHAADLFTFFSILATFIAPEVPAIPEQEIIAGALVFGALYAAQLGYRVLSDTMERFDS